ncbi:cytochrome P450 [Fusarium avenaceum]|nr:cytochrome P450 [Fusarium avenaceum]
MLPILALIIPCFLAIYLVHFVIRSLRSPLRTIPGPWLARFTDGWYFLNIRKGSFQNVNIDLHKKHGTIVRYGPNRYSFNDLEAAKTIYGLGNHFPKSSWYSTWSSPGQWAIFSDQSIKRHSQNRKLYQATYAMSSLVHYEPFVDECADIFTQRLSEISSSSTTLPVDIRHWFQCYAFDVIGLITYAKRFGFLDRGDDVGGVISALDDHLGYATLCGIFPSLHEYLFSIRNYLAGGKGTGRAYVLSFTNERIRESQTAPKPVAMESEVTTEDFLTKFLAKHASSPDVFTQYHVLMGCTSNMVAGSDTTAISLSAVLYYLLKSPHCLAKLREEINGFTERGDLSKLVTFKESQKMVYLQAVIKEALRMHPATGLPLERVVPEGGATISGRFFPEGTIVGINSWVAHRNTRVFGEDANVFNPDRWLVEDSERISIMNRYYMPFGLGSRTCIGRHVSMLEMSKLIPRIIRDFDFELVPSLKQDNWHTHNYWFVKPVDFQVRVERRQPGK